MKESVIGISDAILFPVPSLNILECEVIPQFIPVIIAFCLYISISPILSMEEIFINTLLNE